MRSILHVVGVVVLLAGYSGAALAWRAQARLDAENQFLEANDAGGLSTGDSRQGSQRVEEMYGKAGMLAVSWRDWIKSLTHGRGLAETLVVVSSTAAIGCFVAAGQKRESGGKG